MPQNFSNVFDSGVDKLLTDASNNPLVELFAIHTNNLTVTLATALHLGRFTETVNEFTTALFQGLKEAQVAKPSRVGYQLMEIDVKINNFDFIGLEDASASVSCSARSNILDRLRFSAEGFSLFISRFAPPSRTKIHINELDEDTNLRSYGLNKGGELQLDFRSLSMSVRPLTREFPLLLLRESKLFGFLYLTPLNAITEGNLPAPTLKKIRMSSLEFDPRPTRIRDGKNRHCQLFNGTIIKLLGIPTKVYIDLNLKSSLIEANNGKVMAPYMLLFDKVVERMVPPPVDARAAKLQPKMGWWDTLRYWIHGKVNVQTDVFIYRQLLDRVENPSWCIMIRSETTRLVYSTSNFSLDVKNFVLSLPRASYPFLEVSERCMDFPPSEARTCQIQEKTWMSSKFF